ncbi:FAD-dependent oxidoreductase [Enterobacteriaceae bacterium 4M9]|nr:FAD-dependent oxidoreductase [Enterobacteriaceae bacterium 4M9]
MAAQHIVIIGGGFSGTALALNLLRHAPEDWLITLVEPRALLAQGVAYGTDDPAHRINVPASRMQLTAAEEGDFDRWYRASPLINDDSAAITADGSVYPQRGAFARYVREKLAQAQRQSASRLTHIQDHAVGWQNGWVVTAQGQRLHADKVVLAVSHPAPNSSVDALQRHKKVIANPWRSGALEAIAPGARVAILGTGLTMADLVATLHRRGHRGHISAFSRRGLLPRSNLSVQTGEYVPEPHAPLNTARAWLRQIRQEIRRAAQQGLPWQLVLDDIRQRGQTLWQQMSLNEQRRFLRHLRPWWDVHRYRIAPQVAEVLTQWQQSGQLQVAAARLQAVREKDDGLVLTLGLRHGGSQTLNVDWLILATGPHHGALIQSDRLLTQLAEQGYLHADALGLGIAVDAQSHAVDARGQTVPWLYVVGPAARGRFGELMGLPQVAEHAETVAQTLIHDVAHARHERCPTPLNL